MKKKWRISALLIILLGSFTYLMLQHRFSFLLDDMFAKSTALPGENKIIAVKLTDVNPLTATLEVEYFYNGASGPMAKLQLAIENPTGDDNEKKKQPVKFGGMTSVSQGEGKINVRVSRTAVPYNPEVLRYPSHTKSVTAHLSSMANLALADRHFEVAIDWPSSDPFVLSGTTPAEIDRLYKLCVQIIDSGDQLDLAKKGIEQILLANPEYIPAYAELARYHMKTNWNHAGLEQAEQALRTALRIDPNHANSLTLIGYVYAHQHRFKEAEDAFRKAETIGTKNIWLYANWGELHAMQGKRQAAIAMYRKGVDAPKDLETYERARQDAYDHLLALLTEEKQWQQADTLYQERINRYPDNGCFKSGYAAFHLNRRGDYDNAIVIGTKALEQPCNDGRINTQLILSMAYYTKWATLLGRAKNVREAEQFFSRGQALYSDTPTLMYSLANSQYTTNVIPALKRQGIKIDASDRDGVTALGYTILNHNMAAALILIRNGANVNQRLNPDGLTPLMVAASRGDGEFVSLLLRNGADKKSKTLSGYNAERIARERGFESVANLLTVRSGL